MTISNDPEKLQRKFLKEAAERRGFEDRAFQYRARPTPGVAPAKLYCDRCLAMVRSDSSCPRCDHHETNVIAYCRTCLSVHPTEKACTPWQPPARD